MTPKLSITNKREVKSMNVRLNLFSILFQNGYQLNTSIGEAEKDCRTMQLI